MKLGLSIKTLRNHRGLKQKVFAEKIGISQSYLSQIEHGAKSPSMDVIESISRFLEIPIPVMFWFGLSESDVKEDKVRFYKVLKPLADNLVKEIFT